MFFSGIFYLITQIVERQSIFDLLLVLQTPLESSNPVRTPDFSREDPAKASEASIESLVVILEISDKNELIFLKKGVTIK